MDILNELLTLVLIYPSTPSDSATPLHLQRFYRRYLFFSTTKTQEAPAWDDLLAASGTNVAENDDAESPRRSSVRLSNARLKPIDFNSPPMGVPPFNPMGGPQGDMTPFWTSDDLQWWQLQSPFVDPSGFAGAMGAEVRHMPL
jgi:hypothetical protein